MSLQRLCTHFMHKVHFIELASTPLPHTHKGTFWNQLLSGDQLHISWLSVSLHLPSIPLPPIHSSISAASSSNPPPNQPTAPNHLHITTQGNPLSSNLLDSASITMIKSSGLSTEQLCDGTRPSCGGTQRSSYSRNICRRLNFQLFFDVNIFNCFSVSSVPMQNVVRPPRGRSMSMQEYDLPLRQRLFSAQLSSSPPISCSPPTSFDGHRSLLRQGFQPRQHDPELARNARQRLRSAAAAAHHQLNVDNVRRSVDSSAWISATIDIRILDGGYTKYRYLEIRQLHEIIFSTC